MMRTLIFTAALAACVPAARAQTAPAPATAGAALADRLRAAAALPPRQAYAQLKSRADSGDAPSRELTRALDNKNERREMEIKLFALDSAGALLEQFRNLANSLEAARHGEAALSTIDAKAFGPLPDTPQDPAGEKDGWEHRTEVFAGVTRALGSPLPATGLAHQSEYTHGPWKAELGARALFAPTGHAAPSDGTLEATGSRKIGDSPFRLFTSAELHRDDQMGLARHFSYRTGVEAEILDTARQQLTAAFGVGAATEKHLTGESERHPLTAFSVEYGLKLSARAAFQQAFELESNPRSRTDYEFKSVTAVVYDLSKNLSVRAAYQLMKRGEPVEGYAGRRSEATVGLIIH